MAKPTLKDALLKQTKALPNGAATTYTDPIQLKTGTKTDFVALAEVVLTAPNVSTTELPDTQTITYTVETADDAAFTTPKTVSGSIVQTGAGGVGASTTELRFRPPTDVQNYVRGKAVKTGAANASTSNFTAELVA